MGRAGSASVDKEGRTDTSQGVALPGASANWLITNA